MTVTAFGAAVIVGTTLFGNFILLSNTIVLPPTESCFIIITEVAPSLRADVPLTGSEEPSRRAKDVTLFLGVKVIRAT
jgi:hypothetical protein